MTIRTTATEWVRNIKTGAVGRVKARLVRRDGKHFVQVEPVRFHNKDTFWLAAHVVAE